MKKLIILFCLVNFCLVSFGQVYQEMPQYGYRANRMAFDSTLQIPTTCGVPTLKSVVSVNKKAALAFDSCNNKFYYYNPKTLVWSEVTGGGGTSPNLQQVLDSGNIAADKSITLGNSFDTATIYTRLNLPTTTSGDNKILDMNLGDPNAGGYSRISLGVEYANNGIKPYIEGLVQPNSGYPFKLTGDSLTFGNSLTSGNYLKLSNENSVKLSLPESTSEHFLATSVNGNYADANGNVTVSTGGVAVDTIFRTIGKDSIFYIKNGNTYAIKDSVGSGGGAGSAVSYYLNGGTAASVATYYQMSYTPVISTNADFSLAGNGLISQWLTDVGNPNQLQIAAGNWNFEMYMSASSSGGTPAFYVQLLKYDGSTFTSIASSSVVAENISGGTSIDLYLTSLAIPQTTLLATDRLAIRVYIVNSVIGRTITMHTQDSHLCQIITNFSSGISALNGLTSTTQTFATGTDSSDFKIVSSGNIHTFNLPTASATKRGALSSTDWSTFNGKIGAADTSVFQRKSISAYSIMANNTNAAANTTAQPYVSATDAAYTGIVTFTGTAPTTSVLRYTWSRIGNIINFRFDFGYTNAGFITAVAWEFPSDMPQPTFNSNFVTQPTPYIFIGGTSFTIATAITQRSCLLTRNTGNTAWQFSMATFSGTNTRYFTMYGYYFVN